MMMILIVSETFAPKRKLIDQVSLIGWKVQIILIGHKDHDDYYALSWHVWDIDHIVKVVENFLQYIILILPLTSILAFSNTNYSLFHWFINQWTIMFYLIPDKIVLIFLFSIFMSYFECKFATGSLPYGVNLLRFS